MKAKGDVTYESIASECKSTTNNTTSFMCQLGGNATSALKSLTLRESEAIHVIKQLEDQVHFYLGLQFHFLILALSLAIFSFLQISSVEMEKTAIQGNLDDVLDLVSEQNTSFRGKYDEVRESTMVLDIF